MVFTNRAIFAQLVDKANMGCKVVLSTQTMRLIIIRLSTSASPEVNGSRVYKIGNGDTELMHNKFCIIDYSTVITGSYNWSYKARTILRKCNYRYS